MTTYIANAVDIPAIMSSSNNDYGRTGGAQALYAAGDGNVVTYTYANGLDTTPAISGGFQPLFTTLPSNVTGFSLAFQTTLTFVNPTGVAGSLGFTILQTDRPDVAPTTVQRTYSTLSPGFVTTTDALTGLGQLNSVRLGTLRWTISWANAAVPGQVLTIDRVWLSIVATPSSLNNLTAPAFSTGQGAFDPRKDWAVTT